MTEDKKTQYRIEASNKLGAFRRSLNTSNPYLKELDKKLLKLHIEINKKK